MKKRICCLFVLLALALFATACAPAAPTTEHDLEQLSKELYDSGAFTDLLGEVDISIASGYYGFDAEKVEDSVLLMSTGATTEEIGLFKCKDENATQEVLKHAKKRVDTQRAVYESYAPSEIPKLDRAIVKSEGNYVFYIIAADAALAEDTIEG